MMILFLPRYNGFYSLSILTRAVVPVSKYQSLPFPLLITKDFVASFRKKERSGQGTGRRFPGLCLHQPRSVPNTSMILA